MFKKIKDFTITHKEKAAVSFVAAAVGSYLAQAGLTLKDINSWASVWSLCVGVVTHILVYSTQNT